jgi:predicted phage tail protein
MSTQDTLQSTETARFVHVISEGECVGLANSDNPGQSVFFDGTALMNVSGTLNYDNVTINQRLGTATQTNVPGFNEVEDVISVNTEVKYGAPITRTTTSAAVDAVVVTLQLPNGLQKVDDNGNPSAEAISLSIYTKLTSGSAWISAREIYINGVAESGYEVSYRISHPTGPGTFDVRMIRNTPDTTTPNSVVDQTFFYSIEEIQETPLSYPNSALVALTYDAKTAGGVSATTFDWIGIKMAVPSNYNPVTRAYTGIWDGTMSATKAWTFDTTSAMWNSTTTGTLYWTDNPVWCLYDLLTNHRYGLGEFVGNYEINLPSFYQASEWCDTLVDDGTGSGTLEPRFRFNAQITTAEDSWKLLQNLAGTFNSQLLVANGYITLITDMPTDASALVSRSTISSEGFSYTESASSTRSSIARIAWNNPDNAFQQEEAFYSEADPANGIPWIEYDATAWGCTSHGQALRTGRWVIDGQLRNVRAVTYKAPLSAINVLNGSVIKLSDSRYAATHMDAMVVNVVGTTVVLDRNVDVQIGTSTIDVLLVDGTTIEQRLITSSPGSTNVLTVASAFSQGVITGPGSTAIIAGNISAQYFRVLDVSEDTDGWFNVNALQYDSTKYPRVETGISIPAPAFSNTTGNQLIPDIPTNLGMVLLAPTTVDGTITRSLKLSWTRPANASSSLFSWRRAGDSWTTIEGLDASTYTIPNVIEDNYDVQVSSMSAYGLQSPIVSATYSIDLSGVTTPAIHPVTNLQAQGGGTTFSTQDLNVQWTNPSNNLGLNPALQDFVVKVYTSSGTLLRQEIVDGVPAGSSQSYTYSYTKNQADNANVPIRSIRIDVLARDGMYNTVAATSATFTNPAPAAPTITATSGIQNNTVHMPLPTDVDFAGFVLWGSTTSGFSLSSATKLYDGPSDSFVHAGLNDSQTWYYKAAAYDVFGKDYSGTGLNVSTQISSTTTAGANVNEYQLSGVTWTPNSPSANHVAWTACAAIQTLGAGAGNMWSVSAGNATWTSGILYVYYVAGATTLSSTTNLSSALASSANTIVATYRGGTQLEHGDGNAYTDGSLILAGTVGATQVVTSGLITLSAQINNAVIVDAHFTGLLSAAKIDGTGLVIKDTSGNVILGSGSGLPLAYVPSGALNSNVTLSSAGVLTGAGGGTVTIGGLGFTGALNATYGAAFGTNISGQITSSNVSTFIAAAAIGTAQVGILTAANINTNGLTIRDNSGNLILGAGTTLPIAYAASGTVNSAITIGSNGVLVGGGGGGVTIGGLGFAGDLNATYGANFGTNISGQINSGNVTTFIANAAIQSAQVGVLSASNINTNGLTIRDTSGNLILGSGSALNASYAAAGTVNTAITINSNGTLSGAGGGSVTPAGISAVGAGNPITSSNATTYISSLAVDSLQIANNAVTIPAAAYTAGTITASSSTVIQTLTYTSSGAPVSISAGCQVNTSYGAYSVSGSTTYDSCTVSMSIYRDGTLLVTIGGVFFQAQATPSAALTLPDVTDNPGAGTHTYTITIAGSSTHNTHSASSRSLSILETKK